MGLVKQVALFLPLWSVATVGVTIDACHALPPLPGNVIVEIKLEEKRPPGTTRKDSPVELPAHSAPGTQSTSQPNYPTFNSQQLDRQLQRYSTYLAQVGPPDVLIVGSSRALQGVDPVALSNALSQQGYPNLKVFNFGINGATAQVVNWLLQHLLSPDQLPRVIVWADGARALNSGRIDHTFDKIIASQGYKLLNSGIRPPIPQVSGFELGQICMDLLPVKVPSADEAQGMNPTSTGTKTLASGRDVLCNHPLKVLVRPSAMQTTNPSYLMQQEALGFQVVTARFNPDAYFQRYPQVPGGYDTNYRNFTLEGKQTEALKSIIRFASRRKIPLVFVNLPLTSTYLDWARSDYEEQFQSRMRQVARSHNFLFQDLVPQRSLRQNSYFADPSHLNRYGAIAVATQISKKLSVSFPQILRLTANQPDDTHLASTQCTADCLYLLRVHRPSELTQLTAGKH